MTKKTMASPISLTNSEDEDHRSAISYSKQCFVSHSERAVFTFHLNMNYFLKQT